MALLPPPRLRLCVRATSWRAV